MTLVDYSNLIIGDVSIPLSKELKVTISGGGDNIILTLTQSKDDNTNVNNEIILIDSVLSKAISNANSEGLSNIQKLKLIICSYHSKDGVGSFFNYRLTESSLDKRLNESIRLTFSNDYNKSLIKDEVKVSNTIKNITKRDK